MLFDDSSLFLYVLLIIEGFIVGGGVICVGGDFEKKNLILELLIE